ncbi:MAG: response regulator transcription factor [Candidatus Eisenbacteria bacterium]|uniref:Response regulator transcription factor n=1 Tax=Eiseniibacteriota bacterium TaxID=2212470 RepID=A0A956NA20_UNCEI|nr:response regulator transcription factor [Candidatus Eisenbacteria bacterium]MCB9462708.1 response regulator transcription factor [Candidatus Eisenbacteria bacterium]
MSDPNTERSGAPARGGRILVVEDERHLAEGICENLVAEGYRAESTGEGEVALQWILANEYDLVLLDVMLLGMDGYTVCEEVRKAGKQTPILFLTAKGSVDDRIRGLGAGGDDYLTKPFHLRELLARVQTILRRWDWYGQEAGGATLVRFGENEIDLRAFRGTAWDGQEHELTQKEAMVVKALLEAKGDVVSRDDLLETVWGYEVYPSTRTIDTLLQRLRKKFERDPDAPVYFITVRGVGYRFLTEGNES